MTAPVLSEATLRAHLRLGADAELATASTRSHLGDGRCVGWCGPPPAERLVIDAEWGDRPPPPELSRRFGLDDFWGRWTRAECAAKLADVPIVMWWRRHGLGCPPGHMEVLTAEAHWLAPGLVVSVAVSGRP